MHPTGAECQADVDLEAHEEELGTSRAPRGSALRTSTSLPILDATGDDADAGERYCHSDLHRVASHSTVTK